MIKLETRELFIYDDIGPAWAGMVGTETVIDGLAELGAGEVNVRINSYGGSVDEALAMLEVLQRHDGEVSVSVDSIAASAASLFPVAFQSTAAKHARIMIHNPWGVAMGSSEDMRKTADILDVYRDSIVTVYEQSMDATPDEIKALMDAETWYTAADAQAIGLVGAVTEGEAVEAKAIPANRFKNVPKDLTLTEPTKEPDTSTPLRVAAKLRSMKIAARVRRNR